MECVDNSLNCDKRHIIIFTTMQYSREETTANFPIKLLRPLSKQLRQFAEQLGILEFEMLRVLLMSSTRNYSKHKRQG